MTRRSLSEEQRGKGWDPQCGPLKAHWRCRWELGSSPSSCQENETMTITMTARMWSKSTSWVPFSVWLQKSPINPWWNRGGGWMANKLLSFTTRQVAQSNYSRLQIRPLTIDGVGMQLWRQLRKPMLLLRLPMTHQKIASTDLHLGRFGRTVWECPTFQIIQRHW